MASEQQHAVMALRAELAERAWKTPTVFDSWAFVSTEMAELLEAMGLQAAIVQLGDALLRAGYGDQAYSRNHDREARIFDEMGDVMLMLCTLATRLDIDLDEALQHSIDKIRAKQKSR
jgi:NTP pyrophosphatase (non-canonical NTP hydrolase)